jgi:hypothetical protein
LRRHPQPDTGINVARAIRARINLRVNMISLRLGAGGAVVHRRRYQDSPRGRMRTPGAIAPTERTTLGLPGAVAMQHLSETGRKLRLFEGL